jgi:hypothetical protein
LTATRSHAHPRLRLLLQLRLRRRRLLLLLQQARLKSKTSVTPQLVVVVLLLLHRLLLLLLLLLMLMMLMMLMMTLRIKTLNMLLLLPLLPFGRQHIQYYRVVICAAVRRGSVLSRAQLAKRVCAVQIAASSMRVPHVLRFIAPRSRDHLHERRPQRIHLFRAADPPHPVHPVLGEVI